MSDVVIALDSVATDRDGITSAVLYVSGLTCGGSQRTVLRVGDTLTLKWGMDESMDKFIQELQKIRAADREDASHD
jgi:hypothetical protein